MMNKSVPSAAGLSSSTRNVTPQRKLNKRVIRLIGFLLGVTLAGSYGATYLLTSYRTATAELETTVSDLRKSSSQITGYLQRLDQAEASVRRIQTDAATKVNLDKLRTEMKTGTETQALELLDLRSHVLDLEKELAILRKREATTVRLV